MIWTRIALAVGSIGAGLVALAGGGLTLAYRTTAATLDTSWDVAVDPVPVPWPGTSLDDAIASGEHLVTTRLGCLDCHGQDAGGGIIVEAPPMGRWVAPNLTTGAGGRGATLTNADWVRAVREGITSDGTSSTMPSIDYASLSDRELSDVIAYMTSKPPVDRELPPDTMGPLRAVLFATGAIPVSAELIDHDRVLPAEPPPAEATATYGAHVAAACVGCHGLGFEGGPIPGGNPAWPEAANLTFSEDGLAGWSREAFRTALRTGVRPDGTEIRAPMPWQNTAGMTDTELDALYVYFQSLGG